MFAEVCSFEEHQVVIRTDVEVWKRKEIGYIERIRVHPSSGLTMTWHVVD